MNREFGRRRNSDSSTLPSRIICCAIGLGGRVFTQTEPPSGSRDPMATSQTVTLFWTLRGSLWREPPSSVSHRPAWSVGVAQHGSASLWRHVDAWVRRSRRNGLDLCRVPPDTEHWKPQASTALDTQDFARIGVLRNHSYEIQWNLSLRKPQVLRMRVHRHLTTGVHSSGTSQ